MVRVLGLLMGVWIFAMTVVFCIRTSQPTPEKIQTELAANPLTDLNAPARAEFIDRTASRVNRLDFDDRRKLQRTPEAREFFESMTDAERSDYLDLTLPEGFKQVMLALNKMKPDKRREIVAKALERIGQNDPAADSEERTQADEAMMKKIAAQGMTAFYEEANADVKMDFAPVIEQIQQSLRWRD